MSRCWIVLSWVSSSQLNVGVRTLDARDTAVVRPPDRRVKHHAVDARSRGIGAEIVGGFRIIEFVSHHGLVPDFVARVAVDVDDFALLAHEVGENREVLVGDGVFVARIVLVVVVHLVAEELVVGARLRLR